jgi:hypothetical protein
VTQNAAQTQYGTPTPQPPVGTVTPQPTPEHKAGTLPFTGGDFVLWFLLAGVVLIAVASIIRGWAGRLG